MFNMNKEMIIDGKVSVKEAMAKLEIVKPKILFVTHKNKLIGTLSDGDIRRYLLKSGSIKDEVTKVCNKNPKAAYSIEEAKQKYSNDYIAIPILKNDKLIDIYIGKDNKKNINKVNAPVVINAGGKGTRLEPYTKVLPKPLIPVGEYPIMELIMQKFEEFGCNKFYSIVNYKKQLIKAYFKEIDKKYHLTFVDEDRPLGTAGGLSLLKGKMKEDFFFVNCDTLLMSNYSDIYLEHKKRNSTITAVCAKKKIKIPFGVVETNSKDEFKSIIEKPEYEILTNIGFYIVNPKVLHDIQDNEKIDMPEVIKREKAKGNKVYIYSVDETEWLDMGQIPELEKMRMTIYGE